jgi:hypothetical protein
MPLRTLFRVDSRQYNEIISHGGFKGRAGSHLSGGSLVNFGLEENWMFAAATFTNGSDHDIFILLKNIIGGTAGMTPHLYAFACPDEKIVSTEHLRGSENFQNPFISPKEHNVKGCISPENIYQYVEIKKLYQIENTWIKITESTEYRKQSIMNLLKDN